MQGLFRGHPILLNGFQTFVPNSMRPYYRKRRAENNNTNTRPTSRQRVNSNTARQLNQKSTRSPSPSRANQNARNADELKRMETCAKVLQTVLRVLEVNNLHVAFPDGERFLPGPGVWLYVKRMEDRLYRRPLPIIKTWLEVSISPERLSPEFIQKQQMHFKSRKFSSLKTSRVSVNYERATVKNIEIVMFGRGVRITRDELDPPNVTYIPFDAIISGRGRSLPPAQRNIFRNFVLRIARMVVGKHPSPLEFAIIESASNVAMSENPHACEPVYINKRNGRVIRGGLQTATAWFCQD
jgi:hypothetical protein